MSKPICGIVMPISAIEDCDAQHWSDVKEIISDAIREADYDPQLVSSAVEVNIIQKRIIQNLYQNPIVVCDVSCKNANVMLELGIRLAFDKPTIVIKDDQTGYSFDTSPIEHLTYPRSLRHGTINKFKEELVAKIKGTMTAKEKDPEFSPFLKAFGPIKAVSMETKEVPAQEVILDMLHSLSNKMDRIYSSNQYNEEAIQEAHNKLRIAMRVSQRFVTSKLSREQKLILQKEIRELVKTAIVMFEDDGDNTMVRVTGPFQSAEEIAAISEIIARVSKHFSRIE